MDPGTPAHRLYQWKYTLRYAYILSIDTISVQTIADVCLVIAGAHPANKKLIIVAFTKDDA
jgi:hypothetical protein